MAINKSTTIDPLKQTTNVTPIATSSYPLTNHPPYPINALPNIIRKAVIGYHEYGQQPLSLIACSALANVSLACQAAANIMRDHLLVSPISVYFLIIAGSGERKSAADHTFGQAIRQWEQNIREKLLPKVKTSQTIHQSWKITKSALLLKIKKAKNSNEKRALERSLVELIEQEPIIPLLPTLFFEDATQEAMINHLAHGWPSTSLWSDEGGIVLNGQGLTANAAKFVTTLNGLWDGKAFSIHRKTSKSFTVSHRRLTLNLMMQPLLLKQLIPRNSEVARQSGFLARNLIAYPESTMGTRYYKEPPVSLNGLKEYSKRLTDCLDLSLVLDKNGCKNIPTLIFSSSAKKNWVSFFNKVENGLINPDQWSSIKDFASKSAENAARLAALFHLFEGKEGMINSETVESAIQVVEWHLLETKRLFGTKLLSQTQSDATLLMQWLKSKNIQQTTPRYIQQFSPLRNKQRLNKTISYLSENQYLLEKKIGGKTMLMIQSLSFSH